MTKNTKMGAKSKKPTKKKKAVSKSVAKKSTKKSSKKVSIKIPKIKIWLMEKGINQKDIAKNTEISTNTINRLVNKGKASKSIIKLVANELNISFEELNDLLKDSESIIMVKTETVKETETTTAKTQ